MYITQQHPFIMLGAAADKLRREQVLDDAALMKDDLTPARKDVLRAIFQALELRFEKGAGFSGREFVNRQDIAKRRGNDKLRPHDIKLVRLFVEHGLLIEQRRNLDVRIIVKPNGDKLHYGAGYELIYRVNSDTLYGLLFQGEPSQSQLKLLADAERLRIEGLKAAKHKADHERFMLEMAEGSKVLQLPRTAPAPKPVKRSFVDKAFGWLVGR